MAATAVYVRLAQIKSGARVFNDPPVTFSNISATTAAFQLSAGKYAFDVIGSTFGTVTLQVLGGDGSTYLQVSQASANGHVALDLAAGTYKIAIA